MGEKMHIAFRGDGNREDYKGEERRKDHNPAFLLARVYDEVQKFFAHAEAGPTAFTISLHIPFPSETSKPETDEEIKRLDTILHAIETTVHNMRHPENIQRVSIDCGQYGRLDSSMDSPGDKPKKLS